MKKIISLSVLFSTVLLTGCASIVDGTSQTVMVNTSPTQGASCKLQNNSGTWFVHNTPGSVALHKSGRPLLITCEKGKLLGILAQKPAMKKMVAGNAVFGGLIGAEIDSSDGAAYRYPEQIIVPLHNKSDYIDGQYFGP